MDKNGIITQVQRKPANNNASSPVPVSTSVSLSGPTVTLGPDYVKYEVGTKETVDSVVLPVQPSIESPKLPDNTVIVQQPEVVPPPPPATEKKRSGKPVRRFFSNLVSCCRSHDEVRIQRHPSNSKSATADAKQADFTDIGTDEAKSKNKKTKAQKAPKTNSVKHYEEVQSETPGQYKQLAGSSVPVPSTSISLSGGAQVSASIPIPSTGAGISQVATTSTNDTEQSKGDSGVLPEVTARSASFAADYSLNNNSQLKFPHKRQSLTDNLAGNFPQNGGLQQQGSYDSPHHLRPPLLDGDQESTYTSSSHRQSSMESLVDDGVETAIIDDEMENFNKFLGPVAPMDDGKICFVIDLDETLVHSSFEPLDSFDFIVNVEIDGVMHPVYVCKRPYVDQFLTAVGPLFECVLFTASLSKYADPVTDRLDPTGKIFKHRLFRESCHYYQNNYVKNLDDLDRPVDRIVILDNSPVCYCFHPRHAVPISSWFDDPQDKVLLEMIPYFERLSKATDVPIFLEQNEPPGLEMLSEHDRDLVSGVGNTVFARPVRDL